MEEQNRFTWQAIISLLTTQCRDSMVRVPVNRTEHPIDARMKPAIGMPLGQRVNYSYQLDTSTVVHVREINGHYEAFLTKTGAASEGLELVLRDNLGTTILSATALGALIGGLLGNSREEFIAGAMIGGLAGLTAVAATNAGSNPIVSEAAAKLSVNVSQALAAALRPAARMPVLPRRVVPSGVLSKVRRPPSKGGSGRKKT